MPVRFDAAIAVQDQDRADELFEEMVLAAIAGGLALGRERAEEATRRALGYYAGYFDHETRLRVERLFRCEHPYFGAAAKGPVGWRRAFAIGLRLGRRLNRG